MLLLSVIFIESFSSGILLPVLAPHINSKGGTQLILGILGSGLFISQSASRSINAFSGKDVKFSLSVLLLFTGLANAILVYSESVAWILVSRFLYAFTFSQIKDFIKSTNSETVKSLSLVDVLCVAGYVLGPITGGLIYTWREDFVYNAMVAALLTHINLALVQFFFANSEQYSKYAKATSNVMTNFKTHIEVLKHANLLANWDTFLLKVAFSSSFLIYFTKFAPLMRYKFDAAVLIIAITAAYQNILVFGANIATMVLKQRYLPPSNDNNNKIFIAALVATICNMFGIYYVKTYDYYLLILIPLIFLHSLILKLWNSYEIEMDKKSYDVNNSLANFVSLIMPIVFGLLLDLLGYTAFRVLFMLPLLAFRFRYIKIGAAIKSVFKKKTETKEKVVKLD